MTCPKCHATIEERSNFCPRCGVYLHESRSYRGWIILVAGCGFILAAVVFFLVSSGPFDLARDTSMPPPGAPPAAVPQTASERQTTVFRNPVHTGDVRMQLPTGVTNIYDITGDFMQQIPAAVVADGWIALPVDVCLGGHLWQFVRSNGDVIDIAGGIVGEQDQLGLWQLQHGHTVSGPPLSSWIPGKILRWFSFTSDRSVDGVAVTVLGNQRYVIKIAATSVPDEPGVFTQDDRVVGWTFGPAEEAGFLWNGLDGEDLVYELSVTDHYRATFENSREEQFILALAQTDALPDRQLAALADAFIAYPKFADGATPRHLKREAITARMRILSAGLKQSGQSAEVADAFDARRLSAAGDRALAIDVIGAALNSYGYDAAVDLIEALPLGPIDDNEHPAEELRTLHRQLYSQWLESLLRDGDVQSAGQIYERAEALFPQDPAILLLRIELALAEGDWRTAESLLAAKVYPAKWAERIALLKNRTAAARGEEGKVVIRFHPGSRQIPVTAVLGGGIQQAFVIDTGATMVTIPRSAAEKLGISEEHPTLKRQVQTAGGIVEAYEVVLPSVRLGHSLVHNVKALVLDLPSQPSVGLLGMNYLSLFRMDIHTETGVMTLAPR